MLCCEGGWHQRLHMMAMVSCLALIAVILNFLYAFLMLNFPDAGADQHIEEIVRSIFISEMSVLH